MKKNAFTIAIAIACLLLAALLYQVSCLKRQVTTLQSNLDHQLSWLDSRIRDMDADMEARLQQQASFLADSQWTYGKLDMDARTVQLQCKIIPKVFSPAETTAVLVCAEQQYPMELQNGAFVATVALPLFSDNPSWNVQLQESGTLRTESLDWAVSPRDTYLPTAYAGLSGPVTSSQKGDLCICERSQTIDINISGPQPFQVEAITLLELLDGKENRRIPIDFQDCADSAADDVSAADASTAEVEGAYSYNYFYELNQSFAIPKGVTQELYVEILDNHQLYHRVLIDRQTVDSDGMLLEDDSNWSWLGMEGSIYDADGKILWDASNP